MKSNLIKNKNKNIDRLRSGCKTDRETAIKLECENRVKEGVLINDSLDELADDMSRYIKKKLISNNDSNVPPIFADPPDVYSAYNHLDILLKYYPTGETEPAPIDGSLMKMIKQALKRGREPELDDSNLNMIFGILCVINTTYWASRGIRGKGKQLLINNPPVPPYVNVRDLQKHLHLYERFGENIELTEEEQATIQRDGGREALQKYKYADNVKFFH